MTDYRPTVRQDQPHPSTSGTLSSGKEHREHLPSLLRLLLNCFSVLSMSVYSSLVATENPPEEYGSWQWAAAFGRATGRLGADAFVWATKTGRCAAQRDQASGWAKSVKKMRPRSAPSTLASEQIVSAPPEEDGITYKH